VTPLSYISYDRMFYSIWCAKAERKIKNLKSGVFAKMVTGTYKSHVRSADRRGTWSFSQRGRSEGGGCRGGRFRGGAKGGGGVKEGQGGGSGGGVKEGQGGGSGGGVKEGQGGGSGGGSKGGGKVRGGGVREGQRGFRGGVKGGSKEEPGSKRVKEGGPEGGECQKEERKRFEKKDDFNEKSISKRVY